MLKQKSKFLIVYDYGMGGVWCFVYARSEEQIKNIIPQVDIVKDRPEWMVGEYLETIENKTFDIEDDQFPDCLVFEAD